MTNGKDYSSPLQRSYADVLRIFVMVGYGLVVLLYLVYLTGIVPSPVTPMITAKYWQLSAHEYVEITGIHPGSGWLPLLRRGDGLSMASLAYLALVSVPCLIRILPLLIRQRDWIYALIAAAEITVLLLAASGVPTGGH